MLKNKKLFVVLLITLILLVFSVSSCFAYTYSFDFYKIDETTVAHIVDVLNLGNKSFWINYWSDSETYDIWVVDDTVASSLKFYAIGADKDERYKLIFNKSSFPAIQYKYYIASDTFGSANNTTIYDSILIDGLNGRCPYFSPCFSLYKNNTYTEVFYQAPARVVAQKLEGVEMSQVMKEIVGVLPLIIVVVVSLVGLRKALQMLSMLLHKA